MFSVALEFLCASSVGMLYAKCSGLSMPFGLISSCNIKIWKGQEHHRIYLGFFLCLELFFSQYCVYMFGCLM
jgi:hypothetical protein